MANGKHLTLNERFRIENCMEQHMSFKTIGIELDKDCTTISKEIRNHIIYKKSGAFGRSYNACIHRTTCDFRNLCSNCTAPRKHSFCRFCKNCNTHCPDFKQEFCPKHLKSPYVCNGCERLRSCTLEKHFYRATFADTEYRDTLSESRSGISFTEAEINHLDSFISPLIMMGQSLNHICANNRDSIMTSERTNVPSTGCLIITFFPLETLTFREKSGIEAESQKRTTK